VNALIETTASAYEDPSEVVEYYNSNEQLMQQIQNLAVEEQAIEKCLELAKVTEVKKKFDDIMNKQA
jgi:trigger factor